MNLNGTSSHKTLVLGMESLSYLLSHRQKIVMYHITIPFSIPEVNSGFQMATGLLSMDEEYLVFEFQVQDNVIGLFKSDVKLVKVPLADIISIEYKKKLLSRNLLIRASSMIAVQDIPEAKSGEIKLKIHKKNAEAAAQLASSAMLRISEERLSRLDDGYDRLESL